MYTIRGAITVDNNEKKAILTAVKQLIETIIKQNDLKQEEIISFIFSTTDDLDQVYPGQAVRDMGFTKTSIMCLQEMKVKDSLNKCIRVMLSINNEKEKSDIKHIYLKKAANLREDLNFFSKE